MDQKVAKPNSHIPYQNLLLLFLSILLSNQFSTLNFCHFYTLHIQSETLVISTCTVSLESIYFPLPQLPQPYFQILITLHVKYHNIVLINFSAQCTLTSPLLQTAVRVTFLKYKANDDNSCLKSLSVSIITARLSLHSLERQ